MIEATTRLPLALPPPRGQPGPMQDPWFDAVPDRRGTWSEKWDQARPDELPLWVADMDFRAAEPILSALRARLDHGVLGYPHVPASLLAAVAEHQRVAHGWAVDPAWIVPLPGLVCGLHVVAQAVGEAGSGVLTTTPIYPPFLTTPSACGRRTQHLALDPEQQWIIDPAALTAAVDADTRALWLCQPHNPTGRIFTATELQAVAELAEARDLIVVSDEIWADLVLDRHAQHRPFAHTCPSAAYRTITLTSPSKAWNIPGLGCAFAIISDPELRSRVVQAKGRAIPDVNILGLIAAEAAYSSGGEWLRRCRDYLRANRDHLAHRLHGVPQIRWQPGAATYLAWLDVRQCGVPDAARAVRRAGLFLSDGAYFGAPGWLRLNFGCSRATLDQAIDRLLRALTP